MDSTIIIGACSALALTIIYAVDTLRARYSAARRTRARFVKYGNTRR